MCQTFHHIACCLNNLLFFLILAVLQKLNYIIAILNEMILNSLRHKKIAPENTAKGWPLKLINKVSQVILWLFLLEGQLELAYSLFYYNFEDDVLSLFLLQPVIHLDHLIALLLANVVNSLYRHLYFVNRSKQQFSSKKITNFKFSLNLVSFSCLHHCC